MYKNVIVVMHRLCSADAPSGSIRPVTPSKHTSSYAAVQYRVTYNSKVALVRWTQAHAGYCPAILVIHNYYTRSMLSVFGPHQLSPPPCCFTITASRELSIVSVHILRGIDRRHQFTHDVAAVIAIAGGIEETRCCMPISKSHHLESPRKRPRQVDFIGSRLPAFSPSYSQRILQLFC